jgi:hypothetical protein
MAGLRWPRAGIRLGSRVGYLVFSIAAGAIYRLLQVARARAEDQRRLDQLSRMSPEQLARLELSWRDLLREP